MNTYSKEELEEMHLRWSSVTKYTTAQIRIMAQCFKEKARDLG